MALWTMTPDGTWLLVVPAHRAYAAAMTEDEPLSGEQAERLKAALRKMDAKMGHAVHYGPGEVPLCRAEPVRALWTDELEAVAGCDDCLELVDEDLADNNVAIWVVRRVARARVGAPAFLILGKRDFCARFEIGTWATFGRVGS